MGSLSGGSADMGELLLVGAVDFRLDVALRALGRSKRPAFYCA